ncbi:actin-binding protein, putative [Candida dubliniensis CD36]|uniref:Verprolin n=1 Tax=Candida dubliniensis (strain CD36 / ATCC MYA-646 / CBS 7987 / NCPF 3949 / NRRL Y-17841) TaxID=573826 RepID=B9WC74_CANDC|nr:actin-binding protein, putative [Candida dubliniensis CD36]CAX43996.1 actin-binding protein, putative [Candida dubliniensis CD36]
MAAPPPPPPPPPPPSGLGNLPPGPPPSMPPGRDALLGDIRKGAKLKKATTVDKSKPMIDSKVSVSSAPPQMSGSSSGVTNSSPSAPAVPQLGDIFAGGMPKLKHVDNRSGIVPSSAPKIPTLNTAQVPSRPIKAESSISVSTQKSSNLPPPVPPVAPPIPSQAPPPPTIQKRTPPKVPPTRPKKSSHIRNSSQNNSNVQEPSSKPPPLPSGPPPVPTSAPPLPNNIPPPPPPAPQAPPPTVSARPEKSNQGNVPTAPPLPAGGLPFLSEINAKRDDKNVISSVQSSNPEASPPVPGFLPPPISKNSSSNAPGVPNIPPPPPAPPAPPALPTAPPLPALGTSKKENDTTKTNSSNVAPPAAGGSLPFLAQINAKRNDKFVVDGSNNSYTTKNGETPESSSGVSKKQTADAKFSSSSNAPRNTGKSSIAGKHHMSFNPFSHNKKQENQTPNAPPIPQNVPPVPPSGLPHVSASNSVKATPPVAPPPPSVPHAVPPAPPAIPTAVPPTLPTSESSQNNASSVPTSLPKSDPPLPSNSAPPPPRTKKAAPPPPPPTQGAGSGYKSSSSTSRVSSSNFNDLDLRQNAGTNLRKISASAYTINPRNASNGDSKPEKLVIDDKRFKFVNANALPNPRRFGDRGEKEKLYPSGRGSSVPLDLSLFA